MEDELFLSDLAAQIVNQDQPFPLIRYGALVADVGASQSVVPSYHHTLYLCAFQLLYGSLSLRLQLVLKYFKAIENKLSFNFVSTASLHLFFRYDLACDGQHSEPMRCILLQHLIVVLGH